jgi:toxin ParE1/3/4
LRVTRRAATQIERALDYIEVESPQDANRMRERFRTLFLLPAQHPRAGQAADLPGVRRLSAGPYPYLVFHRVTGDVLLATRFDRPARSREPASARLGTLGPTSLRRTGG